MDDDQSVNEIATAVESLIHEAGGTSRLIIPRGYPHLGLAIIDAVFSLRADYDRHVVPVIDAYCESVSELRTPGARFDKKVPEHTLRDLLGEVGGLDEAGLVKRFNNNHQISPGTHKRKAVTVVGLAEALVAADIDIVSVHDLRERSRDKAVERAARNVLGVGTATWRYVLSLSGVERVKPDVMVRRWVGAQLPPNSSASSGRGAGLLLEQATALLQARGVDVTVRAVDHLVWRKASDRQLGSQP